MWRAWAIVGLALLVQTTIACGGIVVDEQPAPERVCPDDASIHFQRLDGPWACARADGPAGFVFSDETSWREWWSAHTTCEDDAPAMRFEEALLIGVFLQGECEYSGCDDVVPVVRTLHRDGCTLRVRSRPPSAESLGPCRACVQPREFVRIERVLVEGVDDVVFEGFSP